MNTFADKEYLCDVHVAKVRFGGDVLLQPGTEGFAEHVSEDGEYQSEGNQQESPTGGLCSLNRRPGKGCRKKRGGNEIGTASGVDGESAFTGFKSLHRLGCRICYIFNLNVTKQIKAGRVGMSSHGCVIGTRKDMKCGMFERMVSSRFKNEREIE